MIQWQYNNRTSYAMIFYIHVTDLYLRFLRKTPQTAPSKKETNKKTHLCTLQGTSMPHPGQRQSQHPEVKSPKRRKRKKNPDRRFLGGIPKKHSPKKLTGLVARGRNGENLKQPGCFFSENSVSERNPAEIWIFLRSSRWFNTVTQLPRFLLLVQYVYTSPSIYIYTHQYRA